jgi:hypothetical protein
MSRRLMLYCSVAATMLLGFFGPSVKGVEDHDHHHAHGHQHEHIEFSIKSVNSGDWSNPKTWEPATT